MLVVFALVAIVTIAATGSTPGGSDRSVTPSDSVLDTVFTLAIVAFVLGLVFVAYAATQWRELEWSTPRRRNDLRALAVFLAFALALALYVRARGLHLALDPQQTPLDRGESLAPPPSPGADGGGGHPFQFAWLPAVVALVLAAVAVGAFVVAARRRRVTPLRLALAAELALALDVSLDDLRAETDPRRAVIAAYARLERVLAAHGQPRRAADTPEEHVSRALSHLDVDRAAVRRLADLFLQAKFSHHEVDVAMKDDAIAALEHVRDELRAAEAEPGASPATAGAPA